MVIILMEFPLPLQFPTLMHPNTYNNLSSWMLVAELELILV